MPILEDGSCAPSHAPLASSSDRQASVGSYLDDNVSLHTGFVVAAHYPGDAGYESAKVVLYDIASLTSVQGGGQVWMTYYNARWGAAQVGSVTDFTRVRLNVPKGWVNGKAFTIDMLKEASYVAFSCANGRSQQAVIVGLLEHPNLFDDNKEWGHYWAQSFNGVNTLIDKDGAWSITYTGAVLDPNTNTPVEPKVPLAGQIKGPDFSKAYTVMALPPMPPGIAIPPMPSIPVLPALPANPISLPKLPTVPSVPMPGVPALPGLPALPNAPQVPTLPGAPGLNAPGVPSVPGGPSIPAIPSTPGVPSVPTVPSIPGIPSFAENPTAAAAGAQAQAAALAGGATAAQAKAAAVAAANSAISVQNLPVGPTTIMIDKQGSILLDNTNGEVIVINKPERAIQIGARSMVTMVTEKDSFTYVPNGKITFLAGKKAVLNGQTVHIGNDGAIDPMVKGLKLTQALYELANAFTTTILGQLGNAPVMIHPALAAKLWAWKGKYCMPTSPFLSKKGFVE